MEAGGKDRPPRLDPGNYNLPYKFKWTKKTVPVVEGSSETTIEGYMENYKNVSQDIRNQLDAEADAVQIILTWIDNDIYSTVDACPTTCEMWKAIKRNQCDVTNHQVNVQFLLQLQPKWQSFVTLVKQSQEWKTVSYHKLYDILKQHQNEVNKIRAERLARSANPLDLVAQQQPVYHPNHYPQHSLTRSQQAATRKSGKAIVNSPPPTYDQEPEMVAKDDALSKEKEIDKLMALISLSFNKINKPTNNNLRTSSNTSRTHQDNTPRINKGSREHPEQPKSVNDTYLEEQGDTNITIDSLDISTNGETVDQDDDDLAKERDLLASLIKKLKCEINDSKNCNKFLESSNKTLIGKFKGEIKDFKSKNKSLESLNNHFKEANNEQSKTNQLMFKDLKKFQAKLDRYHDVNYASKMEIDCAKAKGDLMSYKI
ncbi:hypothetical protein Tco_0985157 [Tanacetum coccineum]